MFSEHTRRTFFKSAAAASLAYAIGEHHMSGQTVACQPPEADMILMNGCIATQDERRSFASAVAQWVHKHTRTSGHHCFG
jgi:hypothetical protein